MKKLLLFLLASVSLSAMSQTDVSLRITYHGSPVCKYEITIKHGDVAIGQGVTDGNGEVVFSQTMLLSSNLDVYAHKQGGNSDQSFDVKGYVLLDDNNHSDIKMEDILQKITSGSGMPESMFAGSWGLDALDCN